MDKAELNLLVAWSQLHADACVAEGIDGVLYIGALDEASLAEVA
jgi:hypothetical protein